MKTLTVFCQHIQNGSYRVSQCFDQNGSVIPWKIPNLEHIIGAINRFVAIAFEPVEPKCAVQTTEYHTTELEQKASEGPVQPTLTFGATQKSPHTPVARSIGN